MLLIVGGALTLGILRVVMLVVGGSNFLHLYPTKKHLLFGVQGGYGKKRFCLTWRLSSNGTGLYVSNNKTKYMGKK